MKNLTFKDFYEYTLTAERDEYGYHELGDDEEYPKYSFHIYSNNRQINVNCQMSIEDIYNSIGNFIFTPEEDEVTLYPVIRGNCNYSCGLTISIDNLIDVNEGSNLWYTWFGPKGKLIKEILVDALNK